MSPTDSLYLQRCVHLARLGGKKVYPNPYVGCVIVHEERIIGEGFHAYIGGPHAEVEAIQSVQDTSLLKDSTLYVNLEPCCFQGRTPACSDLIIKYSIPRVVIGCYDPNPKVKGKGAQQLIDHGIQVDMSDEPLYFEKFNRALFVNQICERSYITLKWAESSDGFIAKACSKGYQATPITGPTANAAVHKMRSWHHAIMIGTNTAQIDNPKLTTRKFYGEDPIRIIFDPNLRLSTDLHVFSDEKASIILNRHKAEKKGNLQYVVLNQWQDMRLLTQELYQRFEIVSILVEGGSHLLQQFLDQEVWDEVWNFQGDISLQNGLVAPTKNIAAARQKTTVMGRDKVEIFQRENWR